MHAFLHLIRYQEKKDWRDWIAYCGLVKLKVDCKHEAIKRGGFEGALRSNGGVYYTDGIDFGVYMPGSEPNGWYRASKKQAARFSYIKNRRVEKDLSLDGRKTRKNRFWFTNGVKQGQFALDNYPKGWKRGRLKH